MVRPAGEVEDFEQEMVAEYALATAAAGLSDGHVRNAPSVIIELGRSLARPLWSATCDDADRFFVEQRRAQRCHDVAHGSRLYQPRSSVHASR